MFPHQCLFWSLLFISINPYNIYISFSSVIGVDGEPTESLLHNSIYWWLGTGFRLSSIETKFRSQQTSVVFQRQKMEHNIFICLCSLYVRLSHVLGLLSILWVLRRYINIHKSWYKLQNTKEEPLTRRGTPILSFSQNIMCLWQV